MQKTLEFHDVLRLIDERSTAFRAAVAAAPSLDAQVPTCPEWTLFDLVKHLGDNRYIWAATLAAGPDATSKATADSAGVPEAPRELEALLAWSAESTRQLLEQLREAGPDRGSWAWWDVSPESPHTCGAVARHQLQEIAVHTYDAQLTAGDPQPLPEEVALDGVDDFLFTCVTTTSPWPHDPVIAEHQVTEGRSWRLRLDADGAHTSRVAESDGTLEKAGAIARSTAAEAVLVFYGRLPVDTFEMEGDHRVFDQLKDWDPDA